MSDHVLFIIGTVSDVGIFLLMLSEKILPHRNDNAMTQGISRWSIILRANKVLFLAIIALIINFLLYLTYTSSNVSATNSDDAVKQTSYIAETQQTKPKNQLEELIEINKNLPKGDRERLAEALFDYSQILDKANVLWGSANQELAAIGQAWQNGSIATDVDTHIKQLQNILLAAKEYEKTFSQVRDKWKYYSLQTQYIFTDDPANNAALIQNAVAESLTYLDEWSKIQNKDVKAIQNLLEVEQTSFNTRLYKFSDWMHGCENRLKAVKDSIQ